MLKVTVLSSCCSVHPRFLTKPMACALRHLAPCSSILCSLLIEFRLLGIHLFRQLLVPNLQHLHALLCGFGAHCRQTDKTSVEQSNQRSAADCLRTSHLTQDAGNAHDALHCAKQRQRRALAPPFAFLRCRFDALRRRRRCSDPICHFASQSSLP